MGRDVRDPMVPILGKKHFLGILSGLKSVNEWHGWSLTQCQQPGADSTNMIIQTAKLPEAHVL